MSLGNTKLVDHGIQTDESDIRIHIGVYSKCAYIFKTRKGYEAIDPSRHRPVPVYTQGIETAQGYLIKPEEIQGCSIVPIPDKLFTASRICSYPEKGYQGQKGQAATFITAEMLKMGLIAINLQIIEVNDKTMQIRGEDIHIKTDVTIQVKCDYRAGAGHQRCTGNLFLQIKECNPFRIY